jgi:hypothetical protein
MPAITTHATALGFQTPVLIALASDNWRQLTPPFFDLVACPILSMVWSFDAWWWQDSSLEPDSDGAVRDIGSSCYLLQIHQSIHVRRPPVLQNTSRFQPPPSFFAFFCSITKTNIGYRSAATFAFTRDFSSIGPDPLTSTNSIVPSAIQIAKSGV